jgi:hypothetical protein
MVLTGYENPRLLCDELEVVFQGQYTLLRVHWGVFIAWPHRILVQKGSQDNVVTPLPVRASLSEPGTGAHSNVACYTWSMCGAFDVTLCGVGASFATECAVSTLMSGRCGQASV